MLEPLTPQTLAHTFMSVESKTFINMFKGNKVELFERTGDYLSARLHVPTLFDKLKEAPWFAVMNEYFLRQVIFDSLFFEFDNGENLEYDTHTMHFDTHSWLKSLYTKGTLHSHNRTICTGWFVFLKNYPCLSVEHLRKGKTFYNYEILKTFHEWSPYPPLKTLISEFPKDPTHGSADICCYLVSQLKEGEELTLTIAGNSPGTTIKGPCQCKNTDGLPK